MNVRRRIVYFPRSPNSSRSIVEITSNGMAAAGGLIRDANGEYITGFSMKIGKVSINIAELLAVREGMVLAWNRRVHKFILETDSKVICTLIKKKSEDTQHHLLHNLLEDCRHFMRLPWYLRIQHIKRGGNSCADYLARLGQGMDDDYKLWEEPPSQLLSLLEDDCEIVFD